MKVTVKIARDSMTPAMQRYARKLKGRRKAELLEAIALVLAESCAKAAFDRPAARPSSWAPKVDGTPATLRKDNLLSRSPRVVDVTPKRAILGSDRKYAAVHQFGSRKKNIPPRPYFPFGPDGKPTALGIKRAAEAIRVVMRREG